MISGFSAGFRCGKPGLSQPGSAVAPDISGSTTVNWTDNTYFDFYSSQTSTTTDIVALESNIMVAQLAFAHQAINLPADAVNRIGVGTYSTQTASPKRFFFALGTADNVPRVAQSITLRTSDTNTAASSAGAFLEQPVISAVTIPANRYFLICMSVAPYVAKKALAAPRTAYIGATPYVTIFNNIYDYNSISQSRSLINFGGYAKCNKIYSNYTLVVSMKFKI
jgi:hypothetical protein